MCFRGMEGKSGKDESPPEMEMGGKGKGGEGEGANPPVGKAGKTYDDTFVPTKDEISGQKLFPKIWIWKSITFFRRRGFWHRGRRRLGNGG